MKNIGSVLDVLFSLVAAYYIIGYYFFSVDTMFVDIWIVLFFINLWMMIGNIKKRRKNKQK